LGYHYEAVDYLVSQVSVGIGLVISNASVGGYGQSVFASCGGGLTIKGQAQELSRVVWYPAVQEQAVKLNGVGTVGRPFFASPSTFLTLRFVEVNGQGSVQSLFQLGTGFMQDTIQDSQLRGVSIGNYQELQDLSMGRTLTLRNTLLERCVVNLFAGAVDYYYPPLGTHTYYQNPLGLTLLNDSFWCCSVGLTYQEDHEQGHMGWRILDILWDGTGLSFGGNGNYQSMVTRHHNGFHDTVNNLGGTENRTLDELVYGSGTLGTRYIGSTVPALALVDHGSRLASGAGLYHYTMQSNQQKEGSSQVDIGFHYVATDGQGNPLDSDGDGLPDYVEDADGDGTYDSGDIANFNNPDTDTDGLSDGWELQNGMNPRLDESAQEAYRRNYIYDRLDRLDNATGLGHVDLTLDKEGNITGVAP
jgi:hypothetical protein